MLEHALSSGNVTLDEAMVVIGLKDSLLEELNALVQLVEGASRDAAHSGEQDRTFQLQMSAINQASPLLGACGF